MKKFELVHITNNEPYRKFGIEKDMPGVIIEDCQDNVLAIIFNPKNIGEFTVLHINYGDFSLDNEILPVNLQRELCENIEKIKSNLNFVLRPIPFNLYDKVELIVENKKYTKYGLHKGEIGFVVDDSAVKNYIEVDFPYLDENSEFYGDTFSINIDDLKAIN